MSVVIRKEDDGYYIHSVSNNSFYVNGVFHNNKMYFRVGKIIPFDLKIDHEYDDLYWYRTEDNNGILHEPEFREVERIDMKGKGDIVTYVYKDHLSIYNRESKLNRILKK